MHEGFVNYNAGTLGPSMVEGRISQGVVVDEGSDIGGGASTMGTLSGGGRERVSIDKRCLLGANLGLGISLGDDCIVEAGLYLTAGTVVSAPEGEVKAAKATCDFYIEYSPSDGMPYWDTGAPALHLIPDYLSKPADPYNGYEPVDSSAAAIAVQGLLRMGKLLEQSDAASAKRYWQAGLTVLDTLLQEPYLSTDANHQGLILHSIYHRPNGWDYVPAGSKIPNGESSMWGDYHAREAALYLLRIINNEKYYTFFNCLS
jgi:hypothetical protein